MLKPIYKIKSVSTLHAAYRTIGGRGSPAKAYTSLLLLRLCPLLNRPRPYFLVEDGLYL